LLQWPVAGVGPAIPQLFKNSWKSTDREGGVRRTGCTLSGLGCKKSKRTITHTRTDTHTPSHSTPPSLAVVVCTFFGFGKKDMGYHVGTTFPPR